VARRARIIWTWLFLSVFGLFLLQGTIVHWILPAAWQSPQVYVSPNFTLMIVIFMGLFLHRHYALFYGLFFGLMQDFIYYGHMIGPQSFAIGLVGYVAGLVPRRQSSLILYTLILLGLGELMFEHINYGLNRLFSVTSTTYQYALVHFMLPSMLFNMLFGLAVYIPIRKLFERIVASQPVGED
jgi:rod shape-determining protein MreD